MIWVAQMLGLLSFALGIACFYQQQDLRLKQLMVLLNINNALHFFLLGGITACLSSLISALRNTLAIKFQSAWLATLFIAITLVLGLPLIHHPADWLPLLGSCIGSYAVFCCTGIKLRGIFLLGALCWLLNNIWLGSIGGTLLETMLLITNLRTIYLLRKQTGLINT
ncbi:YgjV family protein [Simiduia litorea]|uniref:YgjV family protein n=1 Tax=Simiduia litorea TaxID=1435348 RepID=UPI0036F2A80C